MVTNVADVLRVAAAEDPDRLALSEAESGRTLSWRQLDDLVDRVATGLSDMGLVAGYRVLIAAGNSIEFVAAYLGALRVGLVAVPVNPRSTTSEFVTMIADSRSRVVLADSSTMDQIRQAVTGVAGAAAVDAPPPPRIVAIEAPAAEGEISWEQLTGNSEAPVAAPSDPENLAALLYTSGTSGNPRGAMLTHRALLANIEQVAQTKGPVNDGAEASLIRPDDVVLGFLPMFHVYGLNGVFGQVMRQRARLVLATGFDPAGSLELIKREQITVVPLAPVVIAHWMSEDVDPDTLVDGLANVRLVLSGSAPISPELASAFTRRTQVAVHQGYGLTEAAPVVTLTLVGGAFKSGSVGQAIAGAQIRLVDDVGSAPDSDDAGEIQIKGDNLFSGYWPDAVDGPDDEGWWSTGDVGYLDSDGDLFLVDRVKELVIVSGFNVYPSEIEDVLEELAEVEDSAVIGIDDAETGEAVVAYLKAAPGVSAEVVERMARDHVAARLARFKHPTQWNVVETLPYTATGKVKKGLLRATERRRALGILE